MKPEIINVCLKSSEVRIMLKNKQVVFKVLCHFLQKFKNIKSIDQKLGWLDKQIIFPQNISLNAWFSVILKHF